MTDQQLIEWGAMEEKYFLRLIPENERGFWWMCKCNCRRYFRQKSELAKQKLDQEDKIIFKL